MSLIKKYFANMGNPEGFIGKLILSGMNRGHAGMSKWGFSNWNIENHGDVLDIGCGGGANLARWLNLLPNGTVTGFDYSPVSVTKSRELNKKAIRQGRCQVVEGNVRRLPVEDSSFDYVSAFETIYFWPEIEEAFKEVHRVLKCGGSFFICNEVDGAKVSDAKWTNIMDGMTIYSEVEIKHLLEQAGFCDIQICHHKRGWISLSAVKAEKENCV